MYPVSLFEQVREYINLLPEKERIKIRSAINAISIGDIQKVYVKKLRGPVHELRVGYHRLIYFVIERFLYIVSAFRKKTMKTPKLEIEYALKVYRKLDEKM